MVQAKHHDTSEEPETSIEELARRQGVGPIASVDLLFPDEPPFDEDEHSEFLDWLRELRRAELA